MAVSPEIEQAVNRAAASVRRLLLEMLTADELGEVAVVIGYHSLEPEKRVTTKARTIRVARGRMTAIERTG